MNIFNTLQTFVVTSTYFSMCVYLLYSPPTPFLPIDNMQARWLSGGKREDYQNCSLFYCVLKLCTVMSTLT